MSGEEFAPNHPGMDLLAWFREVTEEIDGTPARLRMLALRRRDLAQQLVQVYGFGEAAERMGVGQHTLASFMAIPAAHAVTP